MSTRRKLRRHGLEELETRDLLAGDLPVGGVLGLRADINGNGTVDFGDFLVVASTFGQEDLPEVNGDIDIDGDVDFHDFSALSHNFGLSTDIPTARIQVVHNSPYASAAAVDVYLDSGLLGPLNDFGFRSATPFIDVPAGVDMKIDVAGPASENATEAIFSVTVNLEEGKTYVAVADGDPGQADGAQKFGIFVSDMGQEQAANAENVELMVFHGSPDAPAVDVVARDVGVLVDDIEYPQFSDGYVSVPANGYTLDITPADDNDTIVASFAADVSTIAGEARVVLASGFLAPPADTDPAFGLLVVDPAGNTGLLPAADAPAPEAALQIIHNSPYAAAATVDVYVNDGLLLDDVNFRDATPFLDVPAEVELKVDITAPDAVDNSSPVFSASVTLEDGKNYVAIAAGNPVVSEGAGAFGVFINDMGRTNSGSDTDVDVLVFHGSPDAPAVDVIARGVGTLVDDIAYPEFAADYLTVPAASYTLDITPGDANETIVASYDADLSTIGGQARVVLASGFLSPPAESDPAFGLLVVGPDGSSGLLPAAIDAAMADVFG